MEKLANLKKAITEIAILLSQDTILKCLIVNDNITQPIPEKDLNDLLSEEYISIYPPVENGIKKIDRHTFLIIIMDSISIANSETSRANISIYVTTDSEHIWWANNKNRLLELCDRVVSVLDEVKLSSAGQINVTSINHVMLSEFRAGYRINLNITDLQIRKAEI